MISSLGDPFDLIVLTEIWAFNIDFYSQLFDNFKFYYQLPCNSLIGGVGIFVHSSITSKQINLTTNHVQEGFYEMLLLELIKNKCTFFVGGFYRHPSFTLSKFNPKFEELIAKQLHKFTNFDFLFLGDFNASIEKYDSCSEITQFLDILINYNFIPLISIPTRITYNCSSILDHI